MKENTIHTSNRITVVAIITGILLYLSKFLREYLADHHLMLFVLGFLPNFGLAFAIPFIYVSNRVRQRKQVKHFGISCAITLLLMILNEIRDRYQPGRIFDLFDIYASLAGVLSAYILFRAMLHTPLVKAGNGEV